MTDNRPVVVAVDGSDGSKAAVRYAAAEAAQLGRPLRIVHVVADYLPAGGMVPLALSSANDDLKALGHEILHDAAGIALTVLPEDRVTSVQKLGQRIPCLLDAAAEGHMIVLGDDRTSRLERIAVGTVVGAVAARTPVPLVTVPDGWSHRHEAPGRRRVVVGVKDFERVPAELVWSAFEIAHQHKASLEIAHVLDLPQIYADYVAGAMDYPAWQATVERHLRGVVDAAAGEYPDVEHRTTAWHGQPAHILRKRAAHAWLLVLARRAHGFPLGHFGGTGRALLRECPCPVEVLPMREVAHWSEIDHMAESAADAATDPVDA